MRATDRDFVAYLHWWDTVNGQCVSPCSLPERGSLPAREAFRIWESTGRAVATEQPRLLAGALQGKASLNLHIKMWASRIRDCLRQGGRWKGVAWEELEELRKEFPFLPPWVWKAVWRQAGGAVCTCTGCKDKWVQPL